MISRCGEKNKKQKDKNKKQNETKKQTFSLYFGCEKAAYLSNVSS